MVEEKEENGAARVRVERVTMPKQNNKEQLAQALRQNLRRRKEQFQDSADE